MIRLRILIFEGDARIAESLGDLLQTMGHEVCASADDQGGARAFAVFETPTLLIIDSHFAEAAAVADRIVAIGRVPHLFMAGDALSVRLLRPEATVIQKPFREAELADGIRRAFIGP